jgi:hypothetical protein
MAKLAGKWIESSAALAGSPTTTTQTAGDNSTKIATTAYADNSSSTAAASVQGNLTSHVNNTSNPHAVTKAQVLAVQGIINTDVDAGAAIAESKLALDHSTASLYDAVGSASSAASAAQSQLNHVQTLTGRAANSDDMGAFTGSNLSASETIKSGMQSLSNAIDLKLDASARGATNGVASLVGGKIPVSQLPNSVMEFQGAWDADTNTPTLADGTGNAGDVYRISVAHVAAISGLSDPSMNNFLVGEFVIYSGSVWQKSPMAEGVVSVNSKTGIVTLVTDDIAEDGSPVNLWFTDARAKAAAVVNTLAGSETDQAPSVSAVKLADQALSDSIGSASAKIGHLETLSGVASGSDNFGAFTGPYLSGSESSKTALQKLSDAIVSAASGVNFAKEIVTLSAGDISNGYYDLGHAIHANSLNVTPFGGPLQQQGVDYTISQPAAVTRVTFAGDMAAILLAGDKVEFKYEY